MRAMTQGERERCAKGLCPGCGKSDCKFTQGPQAHGGDNIFSGCGRRFNFSPTAIDDDGAPVLAEIDENGPVFHAPEWGLWPIIYRRRVRRETGDGWGYWTNAYYILGMHWKDQPGSEGV